jgi:hypothetical protein
MSNLKLPHLNGNSNGNLNGHGSQGLKQTVQEFFRSINWDDQPLEVQQLRLTAQIESQPLSLLLTVNQFFSTINWEGSAIAPVPSRPVASESNSNSDTLTLDDFSDLF